MGDSDTETTGRDAARGMMGGAYGLGSLGSLVYFIQTADSFGEGVIGLLKSFVWPAFLVYELMDFLKM